MKRPGTRSALWAGYLSLAGFAIFAFIAGSPAFAQPVPGGTLNPTTIPKYVIPLVIPPEMPKSAASPAPAADYDIAVRQFQQQILPGGIWGATFPGPGATVIPALPATTIWSYGRAADPLPDSSAITGGAAGVAPAPNSTFNYPAFTVENTANIPTSVRWINNLVDPATGNYRPHLFAVDQTTHWTNPPQANCVKGYPNRTDCETAVAAPYTGPVPLVTHVHGAHVRPHSDGYAQAWWLPGAPGTKGIPASYAEYGSLYTQANNANTVPGSAYYAYENSQAASTIWYHDHALGMTRLNVYAGPAGFWLIRGGVYGDANVTVGPGGPTAVLPGPAPTIAGGDPNFTPAVRQTIREIPVAIQDRSFNTDGSLFYPDSRSFFDGFTGPYIGGAGAPAGPSDISAIWNPEAFFNTMVVNGNTWPNFDVAPARYRLRLLNGCNSRTLNLSLFTITGPGGDGIYGTVDDTTTAMPSVVGAEVPFYQIGSEQGFLPNVVKIVTGFFTTLPGDGTTPAAVAAPDPVQALLLMPAERADVIVDFSGMANGTRIRMINTAPDAPFGGFAGNVPADPLTSGQVMDFVVNTALPVQPTDPTGATPATAPVDLVLPAEPPVGGATVTRQVSLNELSSDQVCVEIDSVTGTIIGTLFSTFPGDPSFLASCAAAGAGLPGGNVAEPMGPRKAQMGIVALSGANLVAVPREWLDPVTEMPLLNSTEIWEMYNTTADAHPVHLHLVGFNVINREVLDAAALASGNLVLTGTITPALPNELGRKDTVVSYPGEVTRVRATFDIPGLYVWHCHIVEHEDNEMMRPFIVNPDLLYANFTGAGLYKWDGAAWSQINGTVPANIVVAGPTLYADFPPYGLYKWDGLAWTQITSANPASMLAAGTTLYATFTGAGLYKWDGTAWSQLNPTIPASMVAAGSLVYADFTGAGLYLWNGTAWSKLSNSSPTSMVAADAVLYAQFAGAGLWEWDGLQWTQITASAASSMALADPLTATTGPMLYANFTGYGVWKWNGLEWSQISPADAANLTAVGAMLYADYGASGLLKWDGFAWSQINPTVPTSMVMAGEILYANYAPYGLYRWDGTAWSQINQTVPASMVSGF